LNACLECRADLPEGGFFSVAQGAIFCRQCHVRVVDARPVSAQVLSALRYYAGHSPEECLKFLSVPAAEKELATLMERFVLYRVGQPMKSRRFMAEIQSFLK